MWAYPGPLDLRKGYDGLSAIVVGDHVELDSYVDIDGVLRDFSSVDTVGDLWSQSSPGPTRDGRRGVDLTASGQNRFASSGQDSYYSTIRGNMVQDGGGWYVRFGGASASAPIVVGAVALMLELDSSLTGADVRQILRDSAVADSFTGAVPNDAWGYGKLDINRALAIVRAGL